MTIATGINKKVRYKKETTLGVAPGASGAQSLRRLMSSLDMKKDTYKSNEIRDDYQMADFRHGVRKVEGSINGELSAGTYKDFMASVVRQAFAAVTGTTSATITANGSSSPQFTRTGGDFTADGLRVGQVVRFGGFTGTGVPNNGVNFLITGMTTTTLTGAFLNGAAVIARTGDTTVSVVPAGKVTYVPTAGHTDDSYSIEHYWGDINQSELFVGCKVAKLDIKLPATGMAQCDVGFMGLNMQTATAPYYTSPTAQTGTGVLAAVNGALFVGGIQVGLLTSLDFSVNGNMSLDAVVGANQSPDVFKGSVDVSGTMTVYFQDGYFRDLFLNETECSIVGAFTANNTPAADFIAFNLPRIKAGGNTKSDGQKGLTQTIPFTALRNVNQTAGVGTYDTTLMIQDAQA